MANTAESVISVIEHFHVINLKLTEYQTVTNIINKENLKKNQISCAHVHAFVCESENIC